MKTIYRSEQGKEAIINLYDSQLSRLKQPWKDVYVDTTFGKTLFRKRLSYAFGTMLG